ncbi:Hypothetical protein NTJ_06714 [Nesidiocoris tenuis]|uniref:Uncharacterized protein n=1 Tax=Nesidiocoris tenuis TaxID=355587 RepID=A0ABN7AR22_9HEMI|nr:Hypothetical protein NTJ_06714 [Nesidiocoris tenuis]
MTDTCAAIGTGYRLGFTSFVTWSTIATFNLNRVKQKCVGGCVNGDDSPPTHLANLHQASPPSCPPIDQAILSPVSDSVFFDTICVVHGRFLANRRLAPFAKLEL